MERTLEVSQSIFNSIFQCLVVLGNMVVQTQTVLNITVEVYIYHFYKILIFVCSQLDFNTIQYYTISSNCLLE